jgi:hypothetical protein
MLLVRCTPANSAAEKNRLRHDIGRSSGARKVTTPWMRTRGRKAMVPACPGAGGDTDRQTAHDCKSTSRLALCGHAAQFFAHAAPTEPPKGRPHGYLDAAWTRGSARI